MMSGWFASRVGKVAIAGVVALAATTQLHAQGPPVTLLSFHDTVGWRAVPSDGVHLTLSPDSGTSALRFNVTIRVTLATPSHAMRSRCRPCRRTGS